MTETPKNTRTFIGMDDLVHVGSAIFGGSWCEDYRLENDGMQEYVMGTDDDVDCSFCLTALEDEDE